MLINGKQVEDKIFQKLGNIPSSFPEYISNLAPKPLSPEEVNTQNHAVNSYNAGIGLFKAGNHPAAVVQLKQAEQIAVKTDNVFLSHINATMARNYESMGDFGNAIQKFQGSINNTFEAKGYYDAENLYKELVTAHQKQGTLGKFIEAQELNLMKSQAENDPSSELMARLGLGAAYKAQNRRENSIEQYAHAYSLQQGRVDYDAVRVEQHEVGFTNKEKIGTDNIQQCVAVILHDPLTKKTDHAIKKRTNRIKMR